MLILRLGHQLRDTSGQCPDNTNITDAFRYCLFHLRAVLPPTQYTVSRFRSITPESHPKPIMSPNIYGWLESANIVELVPDYAVDTGASPSYDQTRQVTGSSGQTHTQQNELSFLAELRRCEREVTALHELYESEPWRNLLWEDHEVTDTLKLLRDGLHAAKSSAVWEEKFDLLFHECGNLQLDGTSEAVYNAGGNSARALEDFKAYRRSAVRASKRLAAARVRYPRRSRLRPTETFGRLLFDRVELIAAE
jgi:hypothetical protein